MTSSKREITNALTTHALSGTPKVTVLKLIKERFKLSDNELEWAVEACNFNESPKKIDYKKFFYNNVTKVANKVDSPNLQLYYIDNFIKLTIF